jgi:hypothetical protein
MQHQPLIVRWSMPITIVLLFVMALAPIRWIEWTNWFSAQIRVVIAPITAPITMAVDAVIPDALPEASERERAIANERDRYRTELLQIRQENERLSELIDQFSRGAAITPDLTVRQVRARRMSNIGDQLLIRTDRIEGLTQGTVVVVDAVQLLGRVSRVDKRTSTVRPITAKSARSIMGVVLLDDSGIRQVRCLLKPADGGVLVGEVARSVDGEGWAVEPGMEVRLLDNQWPEHAQMLLIGIVERIEPKDSQPLRQRIVVRPSVQDLRMVPEVILRLPADDPGSTNADGGDS